MVQDNWYGCTLLYHPTDRVILRVHPKDAHLEYGPISTALREAASKGDAWDLTGDTGRMADAFATYYCGAWWYISEFERSLYLLICAEYLADDGL